MTMDDARGRDVLPVGTRLEKFEFERELGAGGFGVTYLAYDRSLDRRVAIKEYLPHDWASRRPDEAIVRMEDDMLRPVAEVAAHGVSPGLCGGDRVGAGVAGSGPATDSGGLAVAPGLPSTPGPLPSPPPVTMAASRPWRLAVAAVVAVAVAGAGLAWPAGGDAAPETTRTAAGTPGGENARGVERGDGGGVGGPAPPADPAEAAQRGAAMDRADSDTEPDESSAQEDPAPAVPPEAVEAALDLDSAGWLEIQKGLMALGLDPGTPDGRVGGGTRGAVRAYQEGAGKPATGFVDAADVTTLQYAASEADRVEEQRLAEVERRRAEEAEAERQWQAEAAQAERQRRLVELRRPGHVFRDCDSCPEMVVIPAGTFQMGSPASEENRSDDEGPRHRVTLESFAMGVKEVTFDEWDACVCGGGCNEYRPGDRGWGRSARPVINVNWNDAQAYVSWLSETTGARYRLPSESEWEYAARAGTTTPFHTGSRISVDQANYDGTFGVSRTAPVGTFAPNAFGLYDVHGNVWERVEDCWHDDYRGAPSDGTAWTRGGDCGRRVLRGGSWGSTPRRVRSANRGRNTSGTRNNGIGFRVSRALD